MTGIQIFNPENRNHTGMTFEVINGTRCVIRKGHSYDSTEQPKILNEMYKMYCYEPKIRTTIQVNRITKTRK